MSSFAILLSFLFSLSLCEACSYSYDCDEGNSSTTQVCIPQKICISIGSQTVRRSLAYLRSETNLLDLSESEKRQIISAVTRVYRNVNPHHFLHLNYMRVDVLSQWKDFSRQVDGNMTNFDFHMKMINIFQQMNDFHTQYIPPVPIRNTFSWLGFFVKEIFEEDGASPTDSPLGKFIVSDLVHGIVPSNSNFSTGSEIITYDGMDVQDSVKRLGKYGYGSNEAAQKDRGVIDLTYRGRSGINMPLKPFATIGYRNQDGVERFIKLPWMFEEIVDLDILFQTSSTALFQSSKNEESGFCSPIAGVGYVKMPSRRSGSRRVARQNRTEIEVLSSFADILYAEIVSTKAGSIGHLEVSAFKASSFPAFEAELVRLLRRMPRTGLVLDIRGNWAGFTVLVKVLAELLSAREVPEQLTTIRATKLVEGWFEGFDETFQLPEARNWIFAHRAALLSARRVGEFFTGPTGGLFNFYSNPSRKREYFGPVITVIDAQTYSSGDIYAALQADQNRSLLVGTSDLSGAGGATVRRYSGLVSIFSEFGDFLPGDVDFTTAFSRLYRTGTNAGAIIENFGVKPDIRYYPTRNDALHDDHDLFEFLGRKLINDLAMRRIQ